MLLKQHWATLQELLIITLVHHPSKAIVHAHGHDRAWCREFVLDGHQGSKKNPIDSITWASPLSESDGKTQTTYMKNITIKKNRTTWSKLTPFVVQPAQICWSGWTHSTLIQQLQSLIEWFAFASTAALLKWMLGLTQQWGIQLECPTRVKGSS